MTDSDPQSRYFIRPMRLEDLEPVRAIDRLSFSLPWPEKAFHYELTENPASLLWVAETQIPEGRGEVVGMIVVWMILDEVHIATLAVHPEHRGQGVGSHLMRVALKEAILRGVRRAMLEVRAHNRAAQSLYRRFGFEVVSRRLRYYRDNDEDALLMNLKDLGEGYLAWLEDGAPGQWSPHEAQPPEAGAP